MNSFDQKTVLLVNDSDDQLDLMRAIFQHAEYSVLTASSGREGFEQAKNNRFDLLISDVMMPDGSGIDLCRWVRADTRLASVPVLLVSGLRKDVGDVTEGLGVGADDYIELPVEPQHLLTRAERLIERKRMEDVLKESENYFRSLIENISDIISILTPNGIVLYESPSIEQILGYQPGELIGSNTFELIHPDDRERVISDFKKLVKTRGKRDDKTGEKKLPAEYRFHTKKGSWRILETIGKVVDDAARGTVVILNSRDVTEQRRAEKARRATEDKFGRVLENSRDAIYQLNLETHNFEYLNPAAEKISGYSAEELIEGGFPFVTALVHPDDWQLFKDYVHRMENTAELVEADYTIEYRFKTKDKGYRWLRENRTVIRDDEQKPISIIATARDITERKQSREALYFRKMLFKAQSEASIEGVLVVTPNGEIISYNQRFAEMWGVSPTELMGKSAEKFLLAVVDSLVDPQEFLDTVSYLQENPFFKDQVEVVLKDGRIFERYSAPVIDSENTHFGRIWSFRDITKRKNIEDAQRESRQQYEALVNSIDGIVWEEDAKTSRLTFVSKQAERLLGYRVEEWISEPNFWLNHLHPDDRQWVNDFCVAHIKKLENHEFDYRMIAADGRVVWMRDYVSMDSKDGVAQRLRGVMVDITEQKQAERMIKESEQRYRIVAETASDVIITIDEHDSILFANPAVEKVLGYKPDQLIGKKLEIIIPERFYAGHNGGMQRYMQTHKRHDDWSGVEVSAVRGDGREIQIEISFGEYQEDGRRLFTAIIRDITERKLTETALRVSQERYRFLAEAVPQQVWSALPDGSVDYANQRSIEYFGATGEQGAGDRWQQFIHPDDLPVCLQNWTESVKTGKPYEVEFRLKRADGEYQWHLGRATAMRDSDGEIIKWIGTNTNIDELKKAEEAVSQANKRAIGEYERLLGRISKLSESLGSARELQTVYRALYDFAVASVPCTGFFISLYDAKRDVRLPAFASSDGDEVDVSELPPMTMADSPNSLAVSTGSLIIENDFQSAMKGKPVVNIGLDKNPLLPQSCLAAPMSVMGRVVGAVEVQSTEPAAYRREHATALQMAANLAANAIENVRLLEQEQRTAEQLRLSQRLESVGRLAGGIAHDFNNMLTAINGYSELTLRRLGEDNPLRRNIEEIKKAGERSAALTHQLLAFSRKQVLQSKIIDVNEIIADTTKMLDRLIGEDVYLQTKLDPKLKSVSGDAGQLTQVIMNLAVNARDAMPKGGNLTIETKNVYLDEEFAARFVPTVPGSYVLLSVTDTGTGIESKEREHIFEPFYTTKEVGKGTGLGLATVYGIVKQSGGYIWLDSEVGVGTTFNVYLPCIDEDAQKENEKDEILVPKGQETILIVEDEDMVRSLTSAMLEECGYRVIEARSGVEALEIIKNQNCAVDLVMTDIVMPQMGGRELAERLAADCPDLRMLFTSGYTDDEIVRHEVIKEETNFIQKPFTFDALAHKVRECLDGATQRDEM